MCVCVCFVVLYFALLCYAVLNAVLRSVLSVCCVVYLSRGSKSHGNRCVSFCVLDVHVVVTDAHRFVRHPVTIRL